MKRIRQKLNPVSLASLLACAVIAVSLVACSGSGSNTPSEPSALNGSDNAGESKSTASETFGGEEGVAEEEPAVTYRFGETVSTDLVEVTLDDAAFAVALNDPGSNKLNSVSNSLLPKKYDPDKDGSNRFIASKGHSLVSMRFTITNLDRNEIELYDLTGMAYQFVNVEYNGEIFDLSYPNEAHWYVVGSYLDAVYSLRIGTDGTKEVRGYMDIPVEPTSFGDSPAIIVTLPNSDGTTSAFKYVEP